MLPTQPAYPGTARPLLRSITPRALSFSAVPTLRDANILAIFFNFIHTGQVCSPPADKTGYSTFENELNVTSGFDVTPVCVANYEGTPAVAACTTSGPYALSGCAPIVSRAIRSSCVSCICCIVSTEFNLVLLLWFVRLWTG